MSTATITSYLRTYNRLRLLTGEQIGRLWDRYGGLDDPSLEQFVARAVPTMEGAEAATARLATGYISTLRLDELGDSRVPSLNLRDLIGKSLRGVDPREVYARPTVAARTAISTGHTFDEAMRFGRDRAVELAQSDVMLTQRATVARLGESDKRVVGYRRTLTGESCILCATASTQRYTRGSLAPIHTHCDCGWAEIYGDSDPGRVINDQLLTQLRESGAGGDLSYTSAIRRSKKSATTAQRRADEARAELATENDPERRARLRDRATSWERRRDAATDDVAQTQRRLAEFRAQRGPIPTGVTVHEHGELGPVLTREGDHFTGPADI